MADAARQKLPERTDPSPTSERDFPAQKATQTVPNDGPSGQRSEYMLISWSEYILIRVHLNLFIRVHLDLLIRVHLDPSIPIHLYEYILIHTSTYRYN
jgi:hypothetical protein